MLNSTEKIFGKKILHFSKFSPKADRQITDVSGLTSMICTAL